MGDGFCCHLHLLGDKPLVMRVLPEYAINEQTGKGDMMIGLNEPI